MTASATITIFISIVFVIEYIIIFNHEKKIENKNHELARRKQIREEKVRQKKYMDALNFHM